MPIQSSQVNPGALRNDYSGFAEAGRIKGQMYANLGQNIKDGYKAHKEKIRSKAEEETAIKILTDMEQRMGGKRTPEEIRSIYKNGGMDAKTIIATGTKAQEMSQMQKQLGLQIARDKALIAQQDANTKFLTRQESLLGIPPPPKKTFTTGKNSLGENVQGYADENGKFVATQDSYGGLLKTQDNTLTNINRNEGPVPEGYAAIRDKQDNVSGYKLLPGSPQETKILEDKRAAEIQATTGQNQAKLYAGIVTDNIGRAIAAIEESPLMTAGFGGKIWSNVSGTAAHDVKYMLSTVQANLAFDRLINIKKTGATLGQVSKEEIGLLKDSFGAVEQSQSPEQLLYNLDKLEKLYNTVLHGTEISPWDAVSSDEDLINKYIKP